LSGNYINKQAHIKRL